MGRFFAVYGVRTPVEFSDHTALWENGTYVFYGYRSENLALELWGREGELHIELTPEGMPLQFKDGWHEVVPTYDDLCQAGQRIAAALAECEKAEIYEDDRLSGYYEAEDFALAKKFIIGTIRDQSLSTVEKAGLLDDAYDDLAKTLSRARLPDELKLEEASLLVDLDTISAYLERFRNQYRAELPDPVPDRGLAFLQRAEELERRVDAMIADFEKHIKLNKKARNAARLKKDTVAALKEELERVDLPDARSLEIYETLAGDSGLSLKRKKGYLEKAAALVKESAETRSLTGLVEALNRELVKLDESGFDWIRKRLAKDLLDSANAWREEGAPPLSESELAGQIRFSSLHASVSEREGRSRVGFELFAVDAKDVFAGHYLYAAIEDGGIREVTLMG